MPQEISDFISDEFYEKKLNTFEGTSEDFLNIDNKDSNYISMLNSKKPIELVDIKSSNNSRNQSTQEATVIKEILGDLLKAGINYKEIGIIAPFRAQVAEIRRQIELDLMEYFEDSSDLKTVVDTVDRFQGDERDIVIFSLTIGDKSIPKLLQDKRRLNVAISRAKKKFIAVGDWEKALESDTLKNLKKYYEKI
jgi:DNA replication ATP-dependent helicase Dna2